MLPIRLSLTGFGYGPELQKIISIFGKEKTIERLNE
jgi:glutamyl/glutaminyl-tRNA synthetase